MWARAGSSKSLHPTMPLLISAVTRSRPDVSETEGLVANSGCGAGSGGGFRRETRPELLSPALGALGSRDPAPDPPRRHPPLPGEATRPPGLLRPRTGAPPPLGGQSASRRALAQAEAAPANATLIIRDRADKRGPDSPRGWLHSSTFLC